MILLVTGVIAGVAVCSACVLVVLLALGWLLWRLWRKRKNKWAEYEQIAPAGVKNGKHGSCVPSMEAKAAINATLRCVYLTNPPTGTQARLYPGLNTSLDSGIDGSRASLNNYLDTNHIDDVDVCISPDMQINIDAAGSPLNGEYLRSVPGTRREFTCQQTASGSAVDSSGVIDCSDLRFVCVEHGSETVASDKDNLKQSTLTVTCLEKAPGASNITGNDRVLFQLDLVYVIKDNVSRERCQDNQSVTDVLDIAGTVSPDAKGLLELADVTTQKCDTVVCLDTSDGENYQKQCNIADVHIVPVKG